MAGSRTLFQRMSPPRPCLAESRPLRASPRLLYVAAALFAPGAAPDLPRSRARTLCRTGCACIRWGGSPAAGQRTSTRLSIGTRSVMTRRSQSGPSLSAPLTLPSPCRTRCRQFWRRLPVGYVATTDPAVLLFQSRSVAPPLPSAGFRRGFCRPAAHRALACAPPPLSPEVAGFGTAQEPRSPQEERHARDPFAAAQSRALIVLGLSSVGWAQTSPRFPSIPCAGSVHWLHRPRPRLMVQPVASRTWYRRLGWPAGSPRRWPPPARIPTSRPTQPSA